MQDLTSRQRQFLEAIEAYVRDHGVAPTVRELAALLRVRSPNAVRQHLKALERKGYLRRMPRRPRGMVPARRSPGVPVLGIIAAGSPIEVTQEERGWIRLEGSWGTLPDRCFAVEVEGDSMIGAHIVEGDLVVIDPAARPRPGQIVAAVVDGAVTLKTYHEEGGDVELRPANPRLHPIRLRPGEVHDAGVLGVALAVVRRLE